MTETAAPVTAGCLYIVATPIGHRDDMSRRAHAVLAGVDRIAAEDTRHTGRLLRHLGIDARLVSIHEHNEEARVPGLVAALADGATLALVSDAGTPTISDPGYRLVVAAHEGGCAVVPVPGPSAAVAALAAAGQPSDRFVFEGFLPARAGARRARINDLTEESRTLVFYESGRRIEAALADLAAEFGSERSATLARELTKLHETVRRDTLGGLQEFVRVDPDQCRGEIVLVVAGAADKATGAALTLATALDALLPELAPSRAAAVAARLTGCNRREAYREALARGG